MLSTRAPGKRRAAHTLGLLAVLSVLGCSTKLQPPIGGPSDGPPTRGGKLTIATFVRVRTIDPAVAFDEGADPVTRLLFARLFRVSRQGVIEGDLVQQHHLSADGRELTLQLRHDATFHDGTAVLASDVKRSIERALHVDTNCPVASYYDRIVGFDAYHSGKAAELEGVRVLSDHAVRLSLREPDATLLPALTLGILSPVCRSAGATFDPDFANHPCGAGPFRFESWEGQEAIELRRHDRYHEAGEVHVDSIRWMFAVPPTAQRFRFERGELDIVRELTAADSVAFRSDPAWKPFGSWSRPRATRGFFMNTEMQPFDNADFRRAVSFAIDRDQLADLRSGHLVAANSMVPSGVAGHDPAFQGQHHDLEKARELMRKAGYPYDPSTGQGGYPETIDYYCPANSLESVAAELFQQQLQRIGVRINIKAISWGAYLAVTSRRKSTRMGAEGWSADFDDPSSFFDPILSTEAIQDEGSQNRAFYSNPELDQLLHRARREMDPVVRRQLYARADAIVRDDAPWAIIYGARQFDLHQGYVQGYEPHPYAYQDVRSVWIDRGLEKRMAAARHAPPGSINVLALRLSGRRP